MEDLVIDTEHDADLNIGSPVEKTYDPTSHVHVCIPTRLSPFSPLKYYLE